LSETTLRALIDMGFEEPTPVQREAIPILMQGRDVIAQALTGTGKTAAFGVAVVERLPAPQKLPRAIVLAPTRELALQVAEEVHRIAKYRGLRVLPIYGGQSYEPQLRALQRGVDIVVATPGRLMDHMRQGKIDLSEVEMLILDEADEMLNMGFQEDVEFVMARLPEERQTALFSATIPDPIRDLSRKYMQEPITVELSHTAELTVPTVEQEYYVVPFRHKLEALLRLLEVKQAERSIVFAATRRMVDELAESLQARGHSAEALHGDMSQAMRERVMRGFREGRLDILVATDVAARGIDVENVTHVFNFDIPPDSEYYVHRIGRTGRIGKTGQAITLVNPNEQREIRVIERETGARIERRSIPTMTEVAEREREILAGRVERRLQEGNWGPFRDVVEGLTGDHDPIDVAAAALALLSGRQGNATSGDAALDDINVREYEERPAYPARGGRYGARGGRFSGGRPGYVAGRPPQRGGPEQGGDRRFRPSRNRPARG
jgi:ATP-dependent RNA helicase DeaD